MMHNVTMAFDVSLQKEKRNIYIYIFCGCSHELDVDLYR